MNFVSFYFVLQIQVLSSQHLYCVFFVVLFADKGYKLRFKLPDLDILLLELLLHVFDGLL